MIEAGLKETTTPSAPLHWCGRGGPSAPLVWFNFDGFVFLALGESASEIVFSFFFLTQFDHACTN